METLLLKVSVLQEFANLFSNIGETNGNGAYVGSRRASHLSCNRKTDGTYTSFTNGLWHYFGKPSLVRRNYSTRC